MGLDSLLSVLGIILLAFLAGLLAHSIYLQWRGDIAQLGEFGQLQRKLLEAQAQEAKIHQQLAEMERQNTMLQAESKDHQKKGEKQQQQIDVAAHKAAMSRNFLHDVTHSIDAIINQLDELKEIQIADPGQKKGIVNIRVRLGHHIKIVSDDIRDMKRFIEGYGQEIHVNRVRCNLLKLCEEVRDSRSESAALQQIDLTVSGVNGLPKVIVDKEHMRRILTNLVDNGLKYANDQLSKAGGDKPYVRLETALEQGERDVMVVKVCDNGKGMASELVKAFNDDAPLAEDWQKLHIQGSGLGLEIVKLYINAHKKVGIDAQISVHSVVGRGSIFTIKLPLEQAT